MVEFNDLYILKKRWNTPSAYKDCPRCEAVSQSVVNPNKEDADWQQKDRIPTVDWYEECP